MSRMPRVTGRELIAAIGKAGFEILRIKGRGRPEPMEACPRPRG